MATMAQTTINNFTSINQSVNQLYFVKHQIAVRSVLKRFDQIRALRASKVQRRSGKTPRSKRGEMGGTRENTPDRLAPGVIRALKLPRHDKVAAEGVEVQEAFNFRNLCEATWGYS